MTNLEEKRLLEIMENSKIHKHDWVVETYLDVCGEFHIDEGDNLEELDGGRYIAAISEDIIFCWKCSEPLKKEEIYKN